MSKLDYKKAFKELYLPKNNPSIVDVPAMTFAIIDGQGDPNGEDFALATEALYSFSYSVKMSYKSKDVPKGYYDYTVFPLEGVWDLVDKSKPITDKSNFAYSIMIRQPDFLTEELFKRFVNEAKNKKPNVYLEKIRYVTITEGLCCQMLHIGSYDDEPASFEKMEQFCRDNGYERICLKHREIYLSDPRKTEADKLKTVLRFNVRKIH
ncbi:MAG TPA: GyrI-like domain-containing protein [Acetivibrio clariflavus]|nr:GyrI-like domain-containing protein [Acetivibrio clariflavus]